MRRLLLRFRLMHLAPALAVIALTAWAVGTPMGSSPDDNFHLVSTWCSSASPSANCTEGTAPNNRRVPKALLTAICYQESPGVSAACQLKTDFDPNTTVLTDRGNFVGGYPPLFYDTMGLFVGPNILESVIVMRLVSVALFVGLTTALFVLLPRSRRPALIWGWIATTVPLGLFIIASNNPSSWAVMGVGSSWIALLGWFETVGRRRSALGVLFALSVLIAAGSRGDGAIYASLGIVVVLILAFERSKRFAVSCILPLVMVGVCVYYFISAQQVISGLNGFGGANSPGVPGATRSVSELLTYNLLNIPVLWAGVFGSFGLGWLDIAMPQLVLYGAVGAFITVAAVGFSRLTKRKATALAIVALALIVIPVFVLTRGSDIVGEQVQPRYILPLIVMLGGLLVLQAGRRRVQFTRGQIILVTVTLAVAQAVALGTTMRRYITGTGFGGLNLNSGIKWWWDTPVSPMVVLAVGSLCYAGLIWILAREVSRVIPDAVSTSAGSRASVGS